MRLPPASASFLKDALAGRAQEWPALTTDDTNAVVAALEYQGALGLVRQAVVRHGIRGVPAGVAWSLEQGHKGTAARNAALLSGLAVALDALEAAAVPYVALKGVALLATVYDDIGLRPMVDADLLVPDDRMADAAAALRAEGFEGNVLEAPGQVHHWPMTKDGPGGLPMTVELHRRLFALAPYDSLVAPGPLFHRAVEAPLQGRAIRVLEPVDAVLHAAGHLALQHAAAERLVWIADVDRAVRRWRGGAGFWDALRRRAAEWWLTPALADALAAAAAWFGTPDPPLALESTALERQAYRRGRARAPVGLEGARLMSDFRSSAGVAAKVRLARAYLFPPAAFLRGHYGVDEAWKLPYYYGRRILRGLGDIWVHRRRPSQGQPAPEKWAIGRQPRR